MRAANSPTLELADVVAVDRLGLLQVEARRVRVDVLDVERRDELVAAEHVAVGREAPAEEREVVDEALGDEPAVAVVEQVRLGVALGELLVALAHDVGQVAEAGHERGHADVDERVVERDLPRRRREQVLAAQHVRDAHQRVVDGVHERVEGRAVRAHDHEVGRAADREVDAAAHEVVEAEVDLGHAQAQRRLAALGAERRALLVGEVAVEVVVAELLRVARRPRCGRRSRRPSSSSRRRARRPSAARRRRRRSRRAATGGRARAGRRRRRPRPSRGPAR